MQTIRRGYQRLYPWRHSQNMAWHSSQYLTNKIMNYFTIHLWSVQEKINEEIVHVSTGGMRRQNKTMLVSYAKAKEALPRCKDLRDADDISFPLLSVLHTHLWLVVSDLVIHGEPPEHPWALSFEGQFVGGRQCINRRVAPVDWRFWRAHKRVCCNNMNSQKLIIHQVRWSRLGCTEGAH